VRRSGGQDLGLQRDRRRAVLFQRQKMIERALAFPDILDSVRRDLEESGGSAAILLRPADEVRAIDAQQFHETRFVHLTLNPFPAR
jgi:hypothetical protein